jgi:GNAT superfamily N-acetyltransferase
MLTAVHLETLTGTRGRPDDFALQAAWLIHTELKHQKQPRPCVLEDYVEDMHGRTIVTAILADEKVIATGSLMTWRTAHERLIIDVVTHPEHRRDGLGTQVLTELESIAAQQRAAHVVLRPVPSAIPFYDELGYIPDPSLPDYFKKIL